MRILAKYNKNFACCLFGKWSPLSENFCNISRFSRQYLQVMILTGTFKGLHLITLRRLLKAIASTWSGAANEFCRPNLAEGVDEFWQPAMTGWLLVVSNLKTAWHESESRRSVANHQYSVDYSHLFPHTALLFHCLHRFYVRSFRIDPNWRA